MQPGGPGGRALWQAEKACCRQAKQSGAMPKARLLSLSNPEGLQNLELKNSKSCRMNQKA